MADLFDGLVQVPDLPPQYLDVVALLLFLELLGEGLRVGVGLVEQPAQPPDLLFVFAADQDQLGGLAGALLGEQLVQAPVVLVLLPELLEFLLELGVGPVAAHRLGVLDPQGRVVAQLLNLLQFLVELLVEGGGVLSDAVGGHGRPWQLYSTISIGTHASNGSLVMAQY